MSQMVTLSIVTGTTLFLFLFRLKWFGMNEIRKNIPESELCFCFLFSVWNPARNGSESCMCDRTHLYSWNDSSIYEVCVVTRWYMMWHDSLHSFRGSQMASVTWHDALDSLIYETVCLLAALSTLLTTHEFRRRIWSLLHVCHDSLIYGMTWLNSRSHMVSLS